MFDGIAPEEASRRLQICQVTGLNAILYADQF